MVLKKLNYGDTIGVITPGSGKDKNIIDQKIAAFESLGFKIKKGKYLYQQNNYLAGTDLERAYDLNSMFEDTNVKAIICFRGGYGSMRILPYLDLKLIKQNPKIFCGYSDVTLLLNYISEKCNFITFHGPMIISNFNDALTKKSFFNALMNASRPFKIFLPNNCEFFNFNEELLTGKLVGGNLSVICSTIGTPYEIETKDNIFLLEETHEDLYAIDKLITQLKFANKFDKCKAIVLGYFSNDNKTLYNDIEKLVKSLLFPLKKPIIFGVPFGHEYPNITLPIGANISINSNQKIIKINSILVE